MNNQTTPRHPDPPVLTTSRVVPRDDPDRGLRRLADRRTVAATAAVAVSVDVALRSGAASLGTALAFAVAAGALVVAARPSNPQAVGAAAAAAALGAFTAVRSSGWLVPFDPLAATGLLVLAAAQSSGGSLFDLGIPSLLRRTGSALAQFVHGPGYVGRAVRPPTRIAGLLRGTALAVPLVVVLGLLLASADAVFASFFRLPFGIGDVPGHVAFLVAGAWSAAALLRLAAVPAPTEAVATRRPVGEVEACVVLGSLVALYAVFALAQGITVLGGAEQVLGQAGLTRATYARSGFFQLLAVSALTLLTLHGGRALVQPTGRLPARLLGLATAAIALTLVIVAVAVGRLHLYQQEFGLTMLRLTSTAFALWLAVVFVLLGLTFAGVAARRRWFVPASASAALLVLLGLDVINAEAFVIRHNVDHAVADGRFDPAYVAGLSDDAVPALVDALPRLPAADREAARTLLCQRETSAENGFWTYNAARRAASEARATVCPTG